MLANECRAGWGGLVAELVEATKPGSKPLQDGEDGFILSKGRLFSYEPLVCLEGVGQNSSEPFSAVLFVSYCCGNREPLCK
jgi:hypothetical protein